jgi:hypothetical protein
VESENICIYAKRSVYSASIGEYEGEGAGEVGECATGQLYLLGLF